MKNFLALIIHIGLISNTALADIAFINPAPWFLNEDFSLNDVYRKGTNLNLAWSTTDTVEPITVYLYQLNSSLQAVGTNEKIVDSSVNTTSFNWVVGTTKNISFSNLFILSIYQEFTCCEHSADNSSVVFNITQSDTATKTSPSSTASSSGNSDRGSNKVGLAAGLTGMGVFLVMLAVAAGCFVLGYRRGKALTMPAAANQPATETHQPGDGLEYDSRGTYKPADANEWPQHGSSHGTRGAPEHIDEVNAQRPPYEIDGQPPVHELTSQSATPRMELYAPLHVNIEA